jgi:hypothetical protein
MPESPAEADPRTRIVSNAPEGDSLLANGDSPRNVMLLVVMSIGLDVAYVPAGKNSSPPVAVSAASADMMRVTSEPRPSPAPNHRTLTGPEYRRIHRPGEAAGTSFGRTIVPSLSVSVDVAFHRKMPPPPSPAVP